MILMMGENLHWAHSSCFHLMFSTFTISKVNLIYHLLLQVYNNNWLGVCTCVTGWRRATCFSYILTFEPSMNSEKGEMAETACFHYKENKYFVSHLRYSPEANWRFLECNYFIQPALLPCFNSVENFMHRIIAEACVLFSLFIHLRNADKNRMFRLYI